MSDGCSAQELAQLASSRLSQSSLHFSYAYYIQYAINFSVLCPRMCTLQTCEEGNNVRCPFSMVQINVSKNSIPDYALFLLAKGGTVRVTVTKEEKRKDTDKSKQNS